MLKVNSPAINAATYLNDTLQLRDISGFRRIVGSIDLGAFEFNLNNEAPVVTITSPAKNTSFTTGSSITVKANISDPDGYIQKVEITVGNRPTFVLDNPNSGQVSYTEENLLNGIYTIRVKATDYRNASTEQSVIVNVDSQIITDLQESPISETGIVLEKIHPNPTTGKIYYSGLRDGENMQLVDTKGRVLEESKTGEMNLDRFSKGLYIILVGSRVHKIVKE